MPILDSKLRLLIDSVEFKDWDTYLATGIFYGVTTNPKLLANSRVPFTIASMAELAGKAFSLGANEIHLQVWGRETKDLLAVGRELAGIDPRVMVKVPITRAGILCARQLIAEGTNVTLTALHAAGQALIAATLGPKYAAPYLGRMTDGGLNGIEEVAAMNRIIQAMNSPVRLLVASIRQPVDLVTLAGSGLTTFTLLPSLIDQLLENELTRLAAESFEAAAGQNQPG